MRQRIDKWLWYARVVKTRTLAQRLAVSGRVRVNRTKCDSASDLVKVGDVLTIASERGVRLLKVIAPGTRRGPPPEASLLYEDLSPSAAMPVGGPGSIRPFGSGRPTKRDRRQLDALTNSPRDDFPSGDD